MPKFIIAKDDKCLVHLSNPDPVIGYDYIPYTQDIVVDSYDIALRLVAIDPYKFYKYKSFTICSYIRERKLSSDE